jgi:hypothetical protein
MTRDHAERVVDEVMEQLAAIEHQRWAHWQRYMHSNGTKQPDGSLLLPKELVDRWDQQIATDYSQLSDKEKESDREQVRKYLPVIVDALCKE